MDMLRPDSMNSVHPMALCRFVSLLLLIVLAGNTHAQTEGDQWWDGFGRAGTTGRIEALAVYEGDLIAAGNFGYAGDTKANQVARWNGARWEPLGDGLFCPVHALAVYDGDLLAGGECEDRGWPGDACYSCVHRWDGISWKPFGITGIQGWPWPVIYRINALQVYGGRLFVGGDFRREGGNPGDYLLQWDGEAWTAVEIALNGPVHSMTVYAGILIIGGSFTRVDTTTVNRIVAWDGAAWMSLGAGMDPQNTGDSIAVYALYVHGDRLIAGGDFTEAAGENVDRIASWDGMTWSSLGFQAGDVSDPDGPRITALTTYDGDLIAGGTFEASGGAPGNRIALWDGLDWKGLGPGVDGRVYTLVIHDGDLCAGGDFRFADAEPVYHIANWDGASWHSIGPEGMGMADEVSHLVEYDGHLVAAGYFDIAGDTPTGHIAMWDGSGWQPIGAGFGKPVHELTVCNGNLVGVADVARGIAGKTIIEWNGVSWELLGEDYPDGVYALSDYKGNLLVAGEDIVYNTGGDIATWDGTSWETFGHTKKGTVKDFVMFDGDLIAGGHFPAIQTGSGETLARCVAAWDGSTWRALGDGLEGLHWWGEASVADLLVYEGSLIAAGTFRRSGDAQLQHVELRHIAAWDGTDWTSIGSGVNGRLNALTIYNETLVAGGTFTEAGGIEANRVARWNGSEWVPLGSGVDFDVQSLLVQDGYLYVGGKFKTAGGSASYYMARWGDRFPGMVLRFRATLTDTSVCLEWTNPSTERFEGTVVRFSTHGYPAGPEDGEPVPNGNQGRFAGAAGRDTSFMHGGLGGEGTYYYTSFAYDGSLNYSTAAHASVVVPDVFAPDLSIGILQNPCLSQHIDVYLIGSEALDSVSVELRVNDEVTQVRSIDASNTVWLGDYEMKPTDDSVAVSGCAFDYAHNDACVTPLFRACPIEEDGPRVIASLDDRLHLVIDRGSLTPGAYALILPCRQAGPQEDTSSLPAGVSVLRDGIERPGGYRISPPGLLEGCAAHIEYKYTSEDLALDQTADQLYVEQDGVGRLGCYVDEHKRTVHAEIRSPGMFSLRCGEPGSSQIADLAFLDVGPSRPNPFSTRVSVRYEIRAPQSVCASVYDIRGRRVVKLLDTVVQPGERYLTWDGRTAEGEWAPSGVYFMRLQADHNQATCKLALIR